MARPRLWQSHGTSVLSRGRGPVGEMHHHEFCVSRNSVEDVSNPEVYPKKNTRRLSLADCVAAPHSLAMQCTFADDKATSFN